MNATASNNVFRVLQEVADWPPEDRVALAHGILDTFSQHSVSPKAAGLQGLLGLLCGNGPPPTDAECERILDEALAEKYAS